jgi:hypothetical protein
MAAPNTMDALPERPAKATHFEFQHKIFGVHGSYFAMAEDTGEPTFYVPLGEMTGVLTIPALMSGFEIKDTSPDGALLRMIPPALSFVRKLRPGDAVPRELVDGGASWSIDDRHRRIADARLMVLLAGRSGRGNPRDRNELLRMAADPAVRDRLEGAFAAMAETIGLGRTAAAEVRARMSRVAGELSYIEALRDQFALIRMIGLKVTQLTGAYGPDRGQGEEMSRITALLKKPVTEFEGLFEQVDGRCDDVEALLRETDGTVRFVRQMRDEIYRRQLTWSDLPARWNSLKVAAAPAADALVRETYRFLARHFPLSTDWLQTRPRTRR